MNKGDYYGEIALKAAKRAALNVIKQARLENRAIPIWKDGKIVHEVPSIPDELLALEKEEKQE